MANTAVCLSRLECAVKFVGRVGDDAFGRYILDDFAKEGVDTRHMSQSRDRPTVAVLVFIDLSGERYISLWPPRDAAHTTLRPEEIPPDVLDGADWLHTSGLSLRQEPLRSATLETMHRARQSGVKVSLDLNMRLEFFGMPPEDASAFLEAFEITDILFGSASEEILPLANLLARRSSNASHLQFAGVSPSEPPGPDVLAASDFLSAGRRVVVARLGGKGTSVLGPEGHFESPAFKVPVVDTTGSGDAFDGGFLAALIEGRGLDEAARWGNAAAAMNISRVGGRNVPGKPELLTFALTARRTDDSS